MLIRGSVIVVLMFCGWFGFAPASAHATERTVVVYAALDRQFSEPLLREFTRKTGIEVQPVFDTESTKTIGLTNRIRAEKDRPRCDVFWNNEILNTLRLRDEGLLQPCRPANAEGYPPGFRDPDGYWYGFAARARVLIVNTDLVPAAEMPASIRDLANPKWRGRVGIAKPLFGTTASHVACLFAALGPEPAERLLGSFRENGVRILSGNKACAEMVGGGALAFALTDTDDAIIEVDARRPVRIVLPDQENGGLGALLLPNTLAVVRGAPHAREAEALIDYLLSAEVETRLAAGPSAQIPVQKSVTAKSRVGDLSAMRPMRVDFRDALREFDRAATYVEKHFLD